MLKVLVQSNYLKKYGSIEILAVFTKHGMEFEDDGCHVAKRMNATLIFLFLM